MASSRFRPFSALLALMLAAASALGASPGWRQALPNSVTALAPKQVLRVDPLAAPHLAQQTEFQVALKMRDFFKLQRRIEAGEQIPMAEMEAKYLPLPEDYQALIDWAKAEGLTVVSTDPMRLGLFLSGTVAQLQQALQTDFARVTVAEGTFTSAITTPSLPGKVALPVLGVNGLQPHIHPYRMLADPQPHPLSVTNPPYLIKDILTAYGANNLAQKGLGQKIAILIDTYPADSDLTNFWTHNNIPQSLSNIEKVQVVTGALPAPSGEESLDVEWSSGIAPQAKVRIYATTSLSFVNLDKGYQKIISELPTQPEMKQLSISLGLGETFVSSSQKRTDAQYYATLASQGVTVFVSSGDSGSDEGGILQVSYSASDPNVTAVGGTSLLLDGADSVTNEGAWSGSGGGISVFFGHPTWQVGTGIPANTTRRLVPDVASVADPNTGAYVFLNGGPKQFGGTSWSAPTWAGLCALINQARAQNGRGSLGLLNPQIYPLAGTTNFRDITSGSNGAYNGIPGYDETTGLGVPQMNVLLPTLAGTFNTSPSITSFSPNVGVVGTTVLISGLNLDKTIGVKFNTTPATFNILSPNSVQATVPVGATTGPITIAGPSATTTTSTSASFVVTVPLTNDNFNQALVISGPNGEVTGDNLGATKQTGEPNHAGNTGGASVWYKWTAPQSSTYTFDATLSDFDTLMGVYTGTAVNNLTTIVSDDDFGTSLGSSVTFNATAGVDYYIAIDGYNKDEGDIDLIWSISGKTPVISNFTPQSGLPGTQVKITGANFTGATSVKFGGVAGTFVVNSDTKVTATVPANAITGAITVTTAIGTGTSSANFVFVTPAPNDAFANATPIQGLSGRATGFNTGATKEPGEPDHAGNPGGTSVWYNWTAAATGTFTFDTSGSSFDTLLAVYTGPSVDNLTLVGENDDAGVKSTSSISFNTTAGVVYHIAIDGYGGVHGNLVLNWVRNTGAAIINSFTPTSGPVGTPVVISGINFTGTQEVQFGGINAVFNVDSSSRITTTVPAGAPTGVISVNTLLGFTNSSGQFTVTPGPANDNFVDRIALSGPSVNASGSNIGGTTETGEPAHAGNPGGHSIWWSWTSPVDATFNISTHGSGFDTLLGIYTGSAVDSLTEVGSNDDDPAGGSTSAVTLNAKAGATYHIAVDGSNGASGSVTLSIYPKGFQTVLYATHFESAEGFTSTTPLSGQNGWVSSGSGGNGLATGLAGFAGQYASIGGSKAPTLGDTGLAVWRDINYVSNSVAPLVKFSVTMAIEDSSAGNGQHDDFEWRLINRGGDQMFKLSFNNADHKIYSQVEGQALPQATGHSFVDGTIYQLEITMDFSRNAWNAILSGTVVVGNQKIRNSQGPIDLGQMEAAWQLHDTMAPGDNSMVFDDLSIVPLQDSAPKIAFPPQSQALLAGQSANFVIVASGLAPLTYQWMKNNVPIAGATSASFSIPSTVLTDAGRYTVKVTNPIGKFTSPAAVLIVGSKPVITVPPVKVVSAAGRTVVFKVTATGTAPLSYQWSLDGTPIPKATLASLTLRNVQVAQDGNYSVKVTNPLGSADSTPVSLSVGSSFAAVKGTYNGILLGTGTGINTGGIISVVPTAGGSLTGTVSYGGKTYRLSGAFDISGHYTKSLGKDPTGQPVSITLQLGLFGSENVTGTLTIGATPIAVSANHDPYDGIVKIAPQAGKYTLALGSAQGLPAGSGYATVTVDKLGKLRIAGKLGDFSTLSLSAAVDASGAWPFYYALYGAKGYLSGSASFQSMPNTDVAAPVLHWYKPATLTGLFTAGFEGDIAMGGSAYLAQTGVPVLPLNSTHQGTITVSAGGDLASAVTESVQIDTANRVTLSKTTGTVHLTITASSGLITGTVLPNGTTKTFPYNGVVLQKTNTGAGVMKGATATNAVSIAPAP